MIKTSDFGRLEKLSKKLRVYSWAAYAGKYCSFRISTNFLSKHQEYFISTLEELIPNVDDFYEFGVDDDDYITIHAKTAWFKGAGLLDEDGAVLV
jgi:hypothetical protein